MHFFLRLINRGASRQTAFCITVKKRFSHLAPENI
jgi:hypothetical protein